MTIAEFETRRNGTAGLVAMPIRTVDITLDDLGYPGWVVTMRTNIRASVYDAMISADLERWWKALGQVVLEWNLADEDGVAIPLPREVDSAAALDLPVLLLSNVLTRYFEAVRSSAALPKALSDNSEATSSTSAGDQQSA